MDVSKTGSKVPSEVETSLEVQATAGNETMTENGAELLTEVASLTGLPVDWVQTELTQIVKNSGHAPEQLTLEELRASMLSYLEEMNQEMLAQEKADLDMLDAMSIPTDITH